MNRLVIIGNGFDLAHGLKTSYANFIDWYWEQRVNGFATEYTDTSSDILCTFKCLKNEVWSVYHFRDVPHVHPSVNGKEIVKSLFEQPNKYEIITSDFFSNILQDIDCYNWVDIENKYYELLTDYVLSEEDCEEEIVELNKQFAFLREKLIEYLKTIGTNQQIEELHNHIIEFFNPVDFSTEGRKMAFDNLGLDLTKYKEICENYEQQIEFRPERIMLLSFNYTATAKMYSNFNLEFNYIHGDLEHPKNIIFGYGDELDKDYQSILDRNDNELLKNVKSVKYLETRHYHDMLEFLMAAPFQVLIMGHSCGNSDRTLLNTVFEHENCVSIKPFYHKWDDGSDNYLELVQNISRNFTNMRMFRDRVVNKDQCKTM